MPLLAGSSRRLIAAWTGTSARWGGRWAASKRAEITSRRFAEWGTCLRGRRSLKNEKPFPENLPVILGSPGTVPGAGNSGDDCLASGAAWDREPGSANFGGGVEVLPGRRRARLARLSG